MKTKQSMKPVVHGAKKHWAETRQTNPSNVKNSTGRKSKGRENTWSSWLLK